MPSLEERVAYLEGRVEEHARGVGELRDAVVHLDDRLSARIDALDQKVDRFRDELAGRIDSLDQRLTSGIQALDDRLSTRIDALDQKVDRFRDELAGRIDRLDQKVSRQFIWLVGIQVTVLLAVIGVLLAR